MTETHFFPTRSNGWTRLGLPGAAFILFGTPMLWALGVFDATVDPLQHAIIFALSGVVCFGLVPLLVGWALQGFVVRRKVSDDGEMPHAGHAAGVRPGGPPAAMSRPRTG